MNEKDEGKTEQIELVKEQYSQYYQMIRHHTSLSWHIPSFTIACAVIFFGLDTSKIRNWFCNPIIPAACFLVISLFLAVMLVHHTRNGKYASKFDAAVIALEKKYGVYMDVHHAHEKGTTKKKLKDYMTSSKCLSAFLIVLIAASFIISIYFFYLV